MRNKSITLLDLFSGIGGFHLGLERAGFNVKSYNSEIDKYAIDVYKHNFKNSTYVGSVTDVRGSELPRIDAITFGSPCQDFSLAGKREGMGGERSSLILEAIRLIQECRPRFFIWENVKGTFSSNAGRDFTAILQAFANLGDYTIEWQLLNTKWFLPQNRERIYLVGYLRGKRGRQVFPLSENNRRVDEGAKQTQNVGCLTAGGNSGGLHSSMTLIRHRSDQSQEAAIAAMRGRNPENPSDRTTEQRLEINTNGTANTLTSVQKYNLVITDRIRRLSPIEYERLQGFPDNWTANGATSPISDTQRYKMCGNAVTVDVVEAVARNIKNTLYGK